MTVRVLIVDDSPFVREVLREGLSRYVDIKVVGEAPDGKRAEQMVMELRPDVVTMDVVMPMVGGIDAIKSIMTRCPTPIVVVSDVQSDHEMLALKAMEAGAIDTFAKPRTGFDKTAADRLAMLLRTAAGIRVAARPKKEPEPAVVRFAIRSRARPVDIIGVVASTGGPQTLRNVLHDLSVQGGNLPPIAVVQHTAIGFTGALISWLGQFCRLPVRMAEDGKRIEPGTIVVAPDDVHLEVLPGCIARVSVGAKVGGHRPSGTMLLGSLARSFGARAVGVILTGMGNDGSEGARAIDEHGGLVFVEDPTTAIIEGMPRAAIEATRAPIVVPAGSLARALASACTNPGRP